MSHLILIYSLYNFLIIYGFYMNCNVLNLSTDSISDAFLRKSLEIEVDPPSIDGIVKSAMKQMGDSYQSSKASPSLKAEKERIGCEGLDHLFPVIVKDETSKLALDFQKFPQETGVKAELVTDFKARFNQLRKKTEVMYGEWDEGTEMPKIEMLTSNLSCRFGDIFCPIATWVKVGSPDGLYLHANYVTLADETCIATQYPLHTSLFWELCDHHHTLVVDLTNQADMEKGLVSYVPLSKGETLTTNCMTLACTDEKVLTVKTAEYCYTIDNRKKTFDVRRLHYTGWDDHKGLNDQLSELNQIVDLIEETLSKKQQVVVHCRAGVGRTGTVLVAAALKRLIRQGKVDDVNFNQMIDDLVLEARRQRGRDCVQTPAQYRTIWEFGQKLLKNS